MLFCAISSNRFFRLQCPLKECIPGDKTLHILSHFITKTEDELQEMLTRYMLSRLDWFKSVSHKFLQTENISVEVYIDNLCTPGTPLDLLAIYVLARLYRFHIRFFLNEGMWCSNVKKDMTACKLVLLFQSKTDFHETYKGGQQPYLESLNYYTEQGLMPSHHTEVKTVQQEEDLVFVLEEKTPKVQFKWEKELKVSLKRELKLDSMIGFKPKHEQGSHMALCRALFGSSWWFMSWLVVISSDSCHGLWWFMSWFMVVHVIVCGDLWWFMSWFMVICGDLWWFMSWFEVVHVMVCGSLWWFVVVQYMPIQLKIGVASLMPQLQLIWWFVVV